MAYPMASFCYTRALRQLEEATRWGLADSDLQRELAVLNTKFGRTQLANECAAKHIAALRELHSSLRLPLLLLATQTSV